MAVRNRSLALAAALVLAFPGATRAAEPERLETKAFDVLVEAGTPPVVEVTFALALSEISDYPVRVTAIGGGVEEELYFGTLKEGVYRLRAPLAKIRPGPFKVVLRTKVTNRIAPEKRGEEPETDPATGLIVRPAQAVTYVRYLSWEGSLPR